MVLGKLPVPGRPTTSEDSRAMTALVVGAGWGVFGHFFSCRSFLSTGDGPIKFKIMSQKAVKPITTNQPTSQKGNNSGNILCTAPNQYIFIWVRYCIPNINSIS